MSKFWNYLTGNIEDDTYTSGLFKGMNANTGAFLNAGAGIASGIASPIISEGMTSGVGDTLNSLGTVAAAIPGYGALISAGLKVLGGVANRAFGSKMNQANIGQVENNINNMRGFNATASSLDDYMGLVSNAPTQINFSNSFIGKDGWFSHKAKRKANALREQQSEALDWVQNSMKNNLGNILANQNQSLLTNYAAFGGPLDFGLIPVGGAIDYELAQRRLAQKDLEAKKAFGGSLHTHGAEWNNGITIIGNGGSHENNPFEGVPMGIAPDGQPNLVEEGEVIFNDYVFSNRLRVPKAVREKYKLRGAKEMTFADAARKAQKESEERPNDPISKRGLEDIMTKLMIEQEAIRNRDTDNQYSEGGSIHIKPSKRGTFTAAAKKHGKGVQEFASQVLANPDNYSPAMRKKAQFAKNASKWKHASGGPLDDDVPTIWNPNESQLPTVTITPTLDITPLDESALPVYSFNNGYTKQPPLPALPNIKPVDMPPLHWPKYYENPRSSWLTGLRYVPAIGASIGVFSDLMGWTNRPDYTNANTIVDAANSIGNVRYTPIGDYMRYTPLDRLFYANQLGAQAAATRRNIMNTSGGNRASAMAGLLASDYNAQTQLGNLYRQAEEYNLGQREKVANFNRTTNAMNAENDLKAQIANRENSKIRVDAAIRAAAIRDAIDARVGNARSINLTNLFDSIGDIGREEYTRNMIMSNPAFPYWVDRQGNVRYKPTVEAKGGFLTIKKRRK